MGNQRLDLMWRNHGSTFHRCFPGIPPLGWKLRSFFPSKWARFYAHPSGDRPITARGEREEMLRRFYAIESSLFVRNDLSVSVFAPVIKYDGEIGRYRPDALSSVGLKLVDADITDDEDDKGVAFDLSGGVKEINSSEIELLVAAIMRDEIMQTVLIAHNGNIIAPYEGGFDIFSNRVEEINRLRGLFPTWLSERSDGL